MNRTPTIIRARHALVSLALVGSTLAAVAIAPQSASADASDQVVVVDVPVGSGSDLASASLKTFHVDGTKSFTKTVALPTADDTGVNAFALGGDTTGNGSLSLSGNGSYLAIAGYHHVPGPTGQTKSGTAVKPKDTKTATSSDGPGVQRMVARIGNDGAVNTSTLLGTSLSGSAPRGVYTDTGSTFYLSGNGGTTDTGIFTQPFGGGASTAIAGSVSGAATGDQKNTRNIAVAGGNLYTISEKTNLAGLGQVGSGLPTTKSPITRLGSVVSTSDKPVPSTTVLFDTSSGVAGVDTAYVSVDIDDDGTNDEIRKYVNDGTTWNAAGAKTGDYPFITGRKVGGNVELFAAKGSGTGNSLVKFTDSTPTATGTYSSDTEIAKADPDHAFRGVALPPTGWNPGTISSDAPTISTSNNSAGSTIGDAHNAGIDLTLADDDTDPADLTVTATSSNTTVLPVANIHISGTGLQRSVTFEPSTTVGRSTVSFTVKDDADNQDTSSPLSYGLSAAPASASGRYLYESSDVSAAVDVGSGYLLAGAADGTLRLYKGSESGRPVKEFDLSADLGTDGPDIEAMTRVNDTLYVFGSHSNKKNGDLDPERSIVFTAAITGSGASTDVAFLAKRTDLRDALKAWDVSKGNALGFAAGQAAGKDPKASDGFNIEGFELAPGSTTTGYIAFRSPVVGGKAVIVPWTNVGPLLGGTPTFGDAIKLDLGGRSIRDIRKNGDDQYLISAQGDGQSPEWKLFAWNGNGDTTPIGVVSLPTPDDHRTGVWESIVSVPSDLPAGKSVTVAADSGNTTYYGDTTQGTDEKKGLSKSYIDEFTTSSYTDFPAAAANVVATPTAGGVDLAWDAGARASSYHVVLKFGTSTIEKDVSSGTTTTINGLSSSTSYTPSVQSVNGSGKSDPVEGSSFSPLAVPFNAPSDLHSTSTTSSSVSLAWTKVAGATDYIVSQGKGADPRTSKHVGDVSSTSFTGLSAGTAYTYDITAVKADSTTSAASTPRVTASTTTAPVADRPRNLHLSSRTATALTIAWTKKPGAPKYKVRYAPAAGGKNLYLNVGDVSSAQITGLSRGVSYKVQVTAVESNGTQSPYSSVLTASTSNLLPPSGLKMKSRTKTTITLTWTKASGAEGYRIYYGIGSGTRTKVEVTGNGTVTKQITGLKSNTTYTIDIASLEDGGTSRSSYSTPRISVKTSS
jgi:hypothetical protein